MYYTQDVARSGSIGISQSHARKKRMSTREIKKHIRSTKEITRITNVLYLLAASRLSKARKRREQAHRYFKELLHLVSLVDANVKKKNISLLTQRPTRNMLYVVITPNLGFCGGLPSTINRWATTSAEEQQRRIAKDLRWETSNHQVSYRGKERA